MDVARKFLGQVFNGDGCRAYDFAFLSYGSEFYCSGPAVHVYAIKIIFKSRHIQKTIRSLNLRRISLRILRAYDITLPS